MTGGAALAEAGADPDEQTAGEEPPRLDLGDPDAALDDDRVHRGARDDAQREDDPPVAGGDQPRLLEPRALRDVRERRLEEGARPGCVAGAEVDDRRPEPDQEPPEEVVGDPSGEELHHRTRGQCDSDCAHTTPKVDRGPFE